MPKFISLLVPGKPTTFVVEYVIINSKPTELLKYKTGPPENEKAFSFMPVVCPYQYCFHTHNCLV